MMRLEQMSLGGSMRTVCSTLAKAILAMILGALVQAQDTVGSDSCYTWLELLAAETVRDATIMLAAKPQLDFPCNALPVCTWKTGQRLRRECQAAVLCAGVIVGTIVWYPPATPWVGVGCTLVGGTCLDGVETFQYQECCRQRQGAGGRCITEYCWDVYP
jgi:hypothetical protein